MSLKYVAMQQDEACKAAICAKTRLLHLQNQEMLKCNQTPFPAEGEINLGKKIKITRAAEAVWLVWHLPYHFFLFVCNAIPLLVYVIHTNNKLYYGHAFSHTQAHLQYYKRRLILKYGTRYTVYCDIKTQVTELYVQIDLYKSVFHWRIKHRV